MTRAPLGYRTLAVLARSGARLMRWRIDLAGAQHVPRDGGAVLTWNHTGHVDLAVTAEPLLRRTGRWVRFLALRDLWRSRTLGWVPRLARCVPVDRATPAGRLHALGDAVAALRAGDLVMVAPEGRISESFELLPFHSGAVRMAQAADVPVVPTASWGSHRFVTTGRPASVRRGWRLPVVVRIGEPLTIAPEEDPVAATARLEAATRSLLAEARAAYPDGAPAGAWWVPAALGGGAPALAGVPDRHRPGRPLPSERPGDATTSRPASRRGA